LRARSSERPSGARIKTHTPPFSAGNSVKKVHLSHLVVVEGFGTLESVRHVVGAHDEDVAVFGAAVPGVLFLASLADVLLEFLVAHLAGLVLGAAGDGGNCGSGIRHFTRT